MSISLTVTRKLQDHQHTLIFTIHRYNLYTNSNCLSTDMNLYLLVVFLKTVNNYMDNQFPLSTVTPGFKLFAYLLTGVFCHIVLLRVSWEGFLNLDFLNGFKKNISWRISFSCMVKPYLWFFEVEMFFWIFKHTRT